jgi:hypothetical protein
MKVSELTTADIRSWHKLLTQEVGRQLVKDPLSDFARKASDPAKSWLTIRLVRRALPSRSQAAAQVCELSHTVRRGGGACFSARRGGLDAFLQNYTFISR